jgi:hypothetical protein
VNRQEQQPGKISAGRPWFGAVRVLRASSAPERVYDSLRIFDPAKGRKYLVRRRGGWFCGSARLGQPAFLLEVSIDVSSKRPGRRRFGKCLPGFVRGHDGARTASALEAVRASKLARDQVLVRTNLSRPITAGDGVPLDGTFRLGQITRSH